MLTFTSMTQLHLINKHHISLFCPCGHDSAFSVQELLKRLRPETTVNQVADRPDAQCVDGRATKSLGYTGNAGEDICQITNKHHFGFEVSSTSS